MSGEWTSPSPVRRRVSCCRPDSASSARVRRRSRCTIRPSCLGCFFDFGDMRKANATGYFPYTPSLPMLYGLRESLAMLLEEGLENVFARHHRLAEGTRARRQGLGPRAVRPRAQVELGYRERDHGAGRHQCRRGDRHRLPPLQPRSRRGTRSNGGQALPHRPPRRPERAHAAGRHCRRRDGDARCRHQGRRPGAVSPPRRSIGGARRRRSRKRDLPPTRAGRAARSTPAKEKATAGAGR